MPLESVSEAVTLLDTPPPTPSQVPSLDDLTPWRDRIDAIDRALIYLLNKRATCALEIGEIKKKMGLPVYVPSREEQVLQNVMATNPGPLADQAVRRLYERIIDETRALERSTYQQERPPDSGNNRP